MIIDKHGFEPREIALPQNPTMGALAAQSACFFDTSPKSLPTTPQHRTKKKFYPIRRKGNNNNNNNNNDNQKRSYSRAFPAHETRSQAFRAHKSQKDGDNTSSPKDLDSLSSRFRFVSIRKKKRARAEQKMLQDDLEESNSQKENLKPQQVEKKTKTDLLWDNDSFGPFETVHDSKKQSERRERNRRRPPYNPFNNRKTLQIMLSKKKKNDQENEATRIMTGIISGNTKDPNHNNPDFMEWSSKRRAASVRSHTVEPSLSTENKENHDSMCHLYKNCYCETCFNVELEWETRKECGMVRNADSISFKNNVWKKPRKYQPCKTTAT